MQATVDSPLGKITLTEQDGALIALCFTPDAPDRMPETPLLSLAAAQLTEYFSGARHSFDLPLHPQGTAFQQQVWSALRDIPYGQTLSYAQLAARLHRPRACRAVGGANGKNPLPILIPCHRGIGADGGLGGYSCGIEKKRFLLALEQNAMK